jgi:hypothetical protein
MSGGQARAKANTEIISQAEIKRYIRVAMLATKREKERVKLRDSIIPRLEAGVKQDEDSPFLLFIQPIVKSAVPWREEYEKMLKEIHPEDWKKRVQKLEIQYEKVERHLKHAANMAYLAS